MMGSPSLACLVLVFAVLQVQSYALRDAFRDRELNRLQDYGKRQYSNQPSDEQMLRALSRMREFHLRKLMDENEGKLEGSEECKDVHADCHLIGENHCKEEEDEHIKTFVKTYCRATCNVDNCNPKGNIKPPHQPQPTCENQLSNQECEVYEGWGLCTSDYLIKGYMFKYCDLTCNKLLGKCQEKRWS